MFFIILRAPPYLSVYFSVRRLKSGGIVLHYFIITYYERIKLMFTKLTELMDHMLEMGIPGTGIVVKQHGKEIYRYVNGYSDRENNIPMRGDERFYIYSCSKVVTCTAALMLWEQGKFDLDDDLGKYMPEYYDITVGTEDGPRPANTKITIRDLFRMTSGLDYWLTCPPLVEAVEKTGGRCPTRETIAYLAKQPLICDPGTEWHYSLSHDVLAALVEVLSGEKFEDFVQKNIFAPLGITHSTFIAREADLPTISPLYRNNQGAGEDKPRIEIFERGNEYQLGPEYASGGAGCVSTLDDYSTFLEGLKDGKLLKPETLKIMTTDQICNEGQRKTHDQWCGSGTYGYGLGVRCPPSEGEVLVTDFGWGGAAGAYLAIDPEYDLTVFYVQHVLMSPNAPLRSKILPTIKECLTGAEAATGAHRDGI